MKQLIYISIWILCVSQHAFGQYGIEALVEELPQDSIVEQVVTSHSAFKPAIRAQTFASWKKDATPQPNYFFIAPAVDVLGGYQNEVFYRGSAGLHLHAQAGKWFFKLGALGGVGSQYGYVNTRAYYQEQKNEHAVFADIRSRISYTPNEIFNFQVGLDNHFIGEGSRSLFLSDYGNPHPFGQIKTTFWRVEYTVLYQFMREHVDSKWKSKYATTHHISLNATKWLNIGIFETVLFQPKDTLLNRGYEVEYLNPVIFFRPQEYALGSADNVLIGLSIDAKIGKHKLYSQLILDEFNLKEIRKNASWWANKYGIQLGVKGRFLPKTGNFFYRVEYNMMRPYTYAHVNQMQTYGNQNAVLAHPLGANFHEILGELKWQKGKYLAKLFTSYTLQGSDVNGFSYGANIYQPYTLRPGDYGHTIGNGMAQNVSKTILTFDYRIWKSGAVHAFFENHFIYHAQNKQFTYVPVIGIRSKLWNDYRNY